MHENHDIGEPREPDEADGAAGKPVRRQRLTVGARATLLMGMSMGVIAAVTVLPGAASRSVSSP